MIVLLVCQLPSGPDMDVLMRGMNELVMDVLHNAK
jgi:hypothetical protein